MRAALQLDRGDFATVNQYVAWRGFQKLGWETLRFEADRAAELPSDPSLVVVGDIGVVWRRLTALGLALPRLSDVPPALAPFTGRRMGVAPVGEVHRRVAGGEALFLKPCADQLKAFTGHLATSFAHLVRTAHLPDDQPVQWSEPVAFTSEYRGYVRRGALVGWRPYNGGFGPTPDARVIDTCLAAWPEAPRGCAIDLGRLDDGRTVLVEVNDGYALGSYGMGPIEYAKLLADRWAELVGETAPEW